MNNQIEVRDNAYLGLTILFALILDVIIVYLIF